MSSGLAAQTVSPCMVQYTMTEGGILVKTAKQRRSLFRLAARFSGSPPEIRSYNPDGAGDDRQVCGAHWNSKMSVLADPGIQSVRKRPSKLTFHIKKAAIRLAQQRAKQLHQEIKDSEITTRAVAAGRVARTKPSTAARGQCRMWMIDGGSSVHLLRKSDLSDIETANVGPARNRMRLSTANGVIVADRALQFSLSKIHLDGEAYVTEDAPAGIGVLSQGKTVRENKCSYWWRPVEGRDDISICTM